MEQTSVHKNIPTTVMIVAGEASGDQHGAHLVKALKSLRKDIEFVGIGGSAMKKAGVRIAVDASELSVVGITEVFSRLGQILNGMSRAKALLREKRPQLLVLLDFPDFNLHLAAYAKKLGIRVLYYISPQIWAWRQGRVKTIGRRIDHMAVILPFEEPFYRKHGIPATFVGHPLMDDTPLPSPALSYEERLKQPPVIGLLPGSREGEAKTLLPVMLKAARRIQKRHPSARFLASRSASQPEGLIEKMVQPCQKDLNIEIVSDGLQPIYNKSTFIIAASGTVTLETAMAGIPMAVIYKVSPLSYHLGKALIKVDHIALVNLIAGRRLAPELIQHDANPDTIAHITCTHLETPEKLKSLHRDLVNLRHRLGGPGASERVARLALMLISNS